VAYLGLMGFVSKKDSYAILGFFQHFVSRARQFGTRFAYPLQTPCQD